MTSQRMKPWRCWCIVGSDGDRVGFLYTTRATARYNQWRYRGVAGRVVRVEVREVKR